MVKLRDIIAFTLLSAGSPLAGYADTEDDSTTSIAPTIDTLKICEAYLPGIGDGIYLDLPDNEFMGLDSLYRNYLLKSDSGRKIAYGLMSRHNVLYGVFINGADLEDPKRRYKKAAMLAMQVLQDSSFVIKITAKKETDFEDFLRDY